MSEAAGRSRGLWLTEGNVKAAGIQHARCRSIRDLGLFVLLTLTDVVGGSARRCLGGLAEARDGTWGEEVDGIHVGEDGACRSGENEGGSDGLHLGSSIVQTKECLRDFKSPDGCCWWSKKRV